MITLTEKITNRDEGLQVNEEIEMLTKAIWQDAVNTWEELQKIRCTLINIKISVARIDSREAAALKAVADQLEEAISGISKNTGRIRDNAKQIGTVNNQNKG